MEEEFYVVLGFIGKVIFLGMYIDDISAYTMAKHMEINAGMKSYSIAKFTGNMPSQDDQLRLFTLIGKS